MKPPFIVLSGLPASGKSTLGRAIAKALCLPMLDKDDFLEALFESRGIGDADWRRRMSQQADDALIERAAKLSAAVIASWWRHPSSSVASGTPCEWLMSTQSEVVEVHCVCSPGVAAFRFVGRKRHAGHVDGRHTFEELLSNFQTQASLGPLGIGRTIEVRTESEVSIAGLVSRLDCDLSENRRHGQPAA